MGWVGFKIMKTIDHYETEVMITLAMVMGIYSIAHAVHFSGPLAVVVAGIFIGNKSPEIALSKTTQKDLSFNLNLTQCAILEEALVGRICSSVPLHQN